MPYRQYLDNMPSLTPVQLRAGVFVKREDLWCVAGVRGAKARMVWELGKDVKTGFVAAGSRISPRVNIVAQVARRLGLPCRLHMPTGPLPEEILRAKAAGAEIVQHKAGYNTVLISRAREDAATRGWFEMPFMENELVVRQVAAQVVSLPPDAKRIVVPVGSGMVLAGILKGLQEQKRTLPVIGVYVGFAPDDRLGKYAPFGWQHKVSLVHAGTLYTEPVNGVSWDGIALDNYYEAKCVPFLKAGDCFWLVGIRQSAFEENGNG